MATANPPSVKTNTISGKIVLKGSGLPIPDLLVVIFDLDPGQRSDEEFPSPTPITLSATSSTSRPFPGDRLGSILSAADGTWSLTYEDSEFRVANANEKRPDLQLMVFGPEDSDSGEPVVLFNSRVLRQNSGRSEAYLIRITPEQLKEAKIPLPVSQQQENGVESNIEKFRIKKTQEKALREGMKSINAEFEANEAPQNIELRKTIKELILPGAQVFQSKFNFVKENEAIADVQLQVMEEGTKTIDTTINNIDPNNPEPGKGIAVNLVLTADDKNKLQQFRFQFNGKDYFNVPEAKIQELLFKKEMDNGVNAILFSNNPISKYCIQKSTEEKCAAIHTGIMEEEEGEHHHGGSSGNGSTNGNGTTTTNATGISDTDISLYLEKILVSKNTEQFHANGTYKSNRPDDKSVQAKVDSFSLQKGPADTTAFYDFHSLQIAFQHVWQQLLDETIVNLGEKINNDLENSGRKGFLQTLKDRMTGLNTPGKQIMIAFAEEATRFFVNQVPTEISAAFDISFLEYDALNSEDKNKLLSLAQSINQLELTPTPEPSGFFGFTVDVRIDNPTRVLLLRDQGERIIDNVRINKAHTTNQLLRDLQERLLSKYEFTVFAADRNYHSVNFGVMNTFRQQWEPICYQAGKLVKTRALSPKEEIKYSVKTTTNTKITRKQAQKNNNSLNQEVSSTSRAESEIVAKAQDKSNFNMSVKVDYSKISSEVKFGKDAQKDTSQTKKDFREAVIKAAQEFKEERSLEVTTEETFGSEYTESGTMVNPNDELSVTYLFYELQRRYRVSEQLYRVMPVVLVAQQVPSPDQITEGWVIAHDWILNRVLLDDSFRPALQHLAQNNVGDDFAIRELRKNLRQQRTLVNQLQLEFSKLKQSVENKYAAMERAVDNRIDEEHRKRMHKFPWWIYPHGVVPGERPDPEMAKALEQAATDEHKHAVEKAEKMALSVQREVNALHQLTMDYNNAMRQHLDIITQTRRLITHIKENILYYMQAIWSMEPPDQRFMRLFKVKVPSFGATRTLIIEDKNIPAGQLDEDDIFSAFREPGHVRHTAWLHGKINRDSNGSLEIDYKDLVEVADLDSLLGFKGNYMIFPLKEHNALTEMMAAPFIDQAFGAMDPDQLSNVNLSEFSKYICCLHKEKPDEFARLKPVLIKWLNQLLADPLRNGDEIIVPTGSLFIEMLPSDRSLLEDFKLKHREWDVYKVQAEVRKIELENVRYAARLLKEEREDPEIEKTIVVENGNGTHLDVDN